MSRLMRSRPSSIIQVPVSNRPSSWPFSEAGTPPVHLTPTSQAQLPRPLLLIMGADRILDSLCTSSPPTLSSFDCTDDLGHLGSSCMRSQDAYPFSSVLSFLAGRFVLSVTRSDMALAAETQTSTDPPAHRNLVLVASHARSSTPSPLSNLVDLLPIGVSTLSKTANISIQRAWR